MVGMPNYGPILGDHRTYSRILGPSRCKEQGSTVDSKKLEHGCRDHSFLRAT